MSLKVVWSLRSWCGDEGDAGALVWPLEEEDRDRDNDGLSGSPTRSSAKITGRSYACTIFHK
jgi:hypothetical protein